MSKKEKLVWIISGMIALILIIAVVWMFVARSGNSNETDTEQTHTTEQSENQDGHNDQVLDAEENVVFNSDMVGTWLTGVAVADSEDLSYQGFVLRPDGTALSINTNMNYSTWRVEDYKLIFTLENSAVEEVSYIVDYIGRDGLRLRSGDTIIQYTLEAK